VTPIRQWSFGFARCFKKRRDMLELAANIGVGFCAAFTSRDLSANPEFPCLRVKKRKCSLKGLLIQLISNTKEFHGRS
jgi:hypothetical protein